MRLYHDCGNNFTVNYRFCSCVITAFVSIYGNDQFTKYNLRIDIYTFFVVFSFVFKLINHLDVHTFDPHGIEFWTCDKITVGVVCLTVLVNFIYNVWIFNHYENVSD